MIKQIKTIETERRQTMKLALIQTKQNELLTFSQKRDTMILKTSATGRRLVRYSLQK